MRELIVLLWGLIFGQVAVGLTLPVLGGDFWREVMFEKPTKLGGRPSVKPAHPKMDCGPR